MAELKSRKKIKPKIKKKDKDIDLQAHFTKRILLAICAGVLIIAIHNLGKFIEEKITSKMMKSLITQSKESFKPQSEESDISIVYSSFSDLFSGVGWIDQERTTMYHDKIATAFSLQPIIEWIDGDVVSGNESEAKGECVSGRCLTISNGGMYLEGRLISTPYGVDAKYLKHISIKALDKVWVIGFVSEKGSAYESKIYKFNGETFSSVNLPENAFVSSCDGVLGFGGTEDEWIALYGGYRGQAYIFRQNEPPENISKFFEYKIMDGGFEPEIVSTGEDENRPWYIFSKTVGNPRILKIFQSETGSVAGILDFSERLREEFSSVNFCNVMPERKNTLECLGVDSDGKNKQIYLEDDGFRAGDSFDIYSVNLNNYPAEVESATIMETDINVGNSEVKFYLSNDGKKWVKASLGEEINFPDKKGTKLLWHAEFKVISEPISQSTPFFDKIRIDYKVKFL